MGRKMSRFVIEYVHQGAHSFGCSLVPLYGYPILGFWYQYWSLDMLRTTFDGLRIEGTILRRSFRNLPYS